MTVRAIISAMLLIVFGLACLAGAAMLLAGIVPRAEIHMTSGKILAGALVTLGIGAFLAAVDPQRNRLMIVIASLFALSCAAAIAYRLRYEVHPNDPAKLLLPLVLAYPILAIIFFPFGRGQYDRRVEDLDARRDRRDEWGMNDSR